MKAYACPSGASDPRGACVSSPLVQSTIRVGLDFGLRRPTHARGGGRESPHPTLRGVGVPPSPRVGFVSPLVQVYCDPKGVRLGQLAIPVGPEALRHWARYHPTTPPYAGPCRPYRPVTRERTWGT